MSVERFRFRPRVFELPPPLAALDPGALLSRLRGRAGTVLLDSAGGEPAEFSLLGFDPVACAEELGSIDELRPLLARLEPAPGDDVPGPFHGGFLGALAYDLGIAGEELALPGEPWGFPLVAGGLYVDFLVREERAGRAWLVLGDEPGDGRPPVDARRAALFALLAADATGAAVAGAGGAPIRCTPPEEHRARVERARQWIASGEIYQANVAHRMAGEVEGDSVDLYLALRATNRAPYMGYLSLGTRAERGAILSASPELLLELRADGRGPVARTRPIKGTAPRGTTPEEDRERARALLASEKDLAELAMIVDLERNDLGRTAEPGSVRVEGFPTLSSYASVHHLMADVVARPEPGRDAVDVLAAMFPGGSITGAPKARAMELIAELEGEGRGFFSGSLGFLDTRGEACFNILIRTLLWRPRPASSVRGEGAEVLGEVSFRVGGGVTWASDPDAEDQETLDKAASLAAALDRRARGHSGDPGL